MVNWDMLVVTLQRSTGLSRRATEAPKNKNNI